MVATIDKDVLILVLRKEIDDLVRITQLQEKQINNQDKSLAAQKQMNTITQEQVELMKRIIKAQEDMGAALVKQLQEKTDHNIELSRRLQEMQAIIDNKPVE